MRNAIDQIGDSRVSSGATMSRYPTRLPQFIPSFSLWWIGMLHDYWWYADDPAFVRRMLPGVRAVLSFFEALQKPDGSLGPLPWWRFVDWADGWAYGNPPQEADGSSAPFDLLHIMALGWAAHLEEAQGFPPLAASYRARAAKIAATAQRLYWDPGRRLYADTPLRAAWSQQTNALAVLAGVAPARVAADLVVRVLTAPELTQCSLYFRHYLYTALNKVGEGDRYLAELADWYTMIDKYGLTTFSEVLDRPGAPSRSDCHAWSASPNYELFHTVLGIDSDGPHFSRVLIRPFLGPLQRASGSVPHPKGVIEVTLERSGAGLKAGVTLPPGVPGVFVWKGARRPLRPGPNALSV
jgi:glycogen debranching enzyme